MSPPPTRVAGSAPGGVPTAGGHGRARSPAQESRIPRNLRPSLYAGEHGSRTTGGRPTDSCVSVDDRPSDLHPLRLAARASLGILIVLLLVARTGFDTVRGAIGRADPIAIGIAFGLLLVALVVNAIRWRVFLLPLGMDLPVAASVRLTFIGTFFNAFLPTGIGGRRLQDRDAPDLRRRALPAARVGGPRSARGPRGPRCAGTGRERGG